MGAASRRRVGKSPGGFQSGLFFASRTNATKRAAALDAGGMVTGRVARAGLRFPWGAPRLLQSRAFLFLLSGKREDTALGVSGREGA